MFGLDALVQEDHKKNDSVVACTNSSPSFVVKSVNTQGCGNSKCYEVKNKNNLLTGSVTMWQLGFSHFSAELKSLKLLQLLEISIKNVQVEGRKKIFTCFILFLFVCILFLIVGLK